MKIIIQMFENIIEFYYEIHFIIFELILPPPLTPPEMFHPLFPEPYLLFVKQTSDLFVLQGNFTSIKTELD